MSKERLAEYHRSTGFSLEPFRDPNKCYELFVHGLGKTKFFIQIGMIIGDTDKHNKASGFRGGNGKYRLHTCRDCTVTTPNSDNPYAKCEPRLVSYTKPYLEWVLKNIHHSDGKLPNLPDSFDITKQSCRYADQSKMNGVDKYHKTRLFQPFSTTISVVISRESMVLPLSKLYNNFS